MDVKNNLDCKHRQARGQGGGKGVSCPVTWGGILPQAWAKLPVSLNIATVNSSSGKPPPTVKVYNLFIK